MDEREAIIQYFKNLPEETKTNIYLTIRNNLSEKIKEDEDFLEDMLPTIESNFKNKDVMIESMTDDALGSGISLEEADEFVKEWPSWIMRL